MTFVNSSGMQFNHLSDGDFVIPELVMGLKNSLKVSPAYEVPTKEAYDRGDYARSWAVYMRKDENNGLGKLSIPSLRLSLNLNKIHGDFIQKTEPKTTYVQKDGLCRTEEDILKEEKKEEKDSKDGDDGYGKGKKDGKGGKGYSWNYKLKGADWGEKFPACAIDKQSPINLIDPINDYGQAYDIYDSGDDQQQSSYWDLGSSYAPLLLGWDTAANSVSGFLDPIHGSSSFSSKLGENVFKGPARWDGLTFHFHSDSEHTINDKRFDLELQVYHTIPFAKNEDDEIGNVSTTRRRRMEESRDISSHPDWIKAAEIKKSYTNAQENDGGFRLGAVAVLFDASLPQNDSPLNKAVNKFFDEVRLQQDPDNHDVIRLHMSELMNGLNWSNRYVYKGSVTYPPCVHYVLWNVMREVYPIRQQDVNLIKDLQESWSGLRDNYREIQTGFNADVIYVESLARKAIASVVAIGTLVMALSQ